jgi:hypothetical protein
VVRLEVAGDHSGLELNGRMVDLEVGIKIVDGPGQDIRGERSEVATLNSAASMEAIHKPRSRVRLRRAR